MKFIILCICLLLFFTPFIISTQDQTTNQSSIIQFKETTLYYSIQQAPGQNINNSNICPTCSNTSSDIASQLATTINQLIATVWSVVTNTTFITAFTILLVSGGLIFSLKKAGLWRG